MQETDPVSPVLNPSAEPKVDSPKPDARPDSSSATNSEPSFYSQIGRRVRAFTREIVSIATVRAVFPYIAYVESLVFKIFYCWVFYKKLLAPSVPTAPAVTFLGTGAAIILFGPHIIFRNVFPNEQR